MPLLTSYPTWVKGLSILWIVFTLAVIYVWFSKTPQKENTESTTQTLGTPLYEKTKQKIDDFYTNLDRDQLTPWMFFRIGKMHGVKDYYGKSIYEGGGGGEFAGSPVTVFWSDDFIEPFLKHEITEILEEVCNEALEKKLNPEPCINEAVGLLNGCIDRVYNRMAIIDQKLRGKGYPKSVSRRDVSEETSKMYEYLEQRQAYFTEVAKLQYRYYLKIESRQNKTIIISIIALVVSIITAIIPLFIKLIQYLIK